MTGDERDLRAAMAASTGQPRRSVIEAWLTERQPLLDDAARAVETDRWLGVLDGLGPLQSLFDDPEVSDVLINGSGAVWVERSGVLMASHVSVSAHEVDALIERAFHRTGRSVDHAHPIGDTRLGDGTRVSVVLEPIAPDGPLVALRRSRRRRVGLDEFGSPDVVAMIRTAVAARANVLVFGATGSGKTTFVAAMASLARHDERLITMEDAAELDIDHPHVCSLETRPANADGTGGVGLRQLVAATLRLRPDRLILGEARGPEALDVVWALASGHRGSFATIHAASAHGALGRIETFVAMADAALPHHVIAAQVRGAFDLAIGIDRTSQGRRVVSIDAVNPARDDNPLRSLWSAT